jgi:RNA polymerase primary sigma factor
VSEKNDGLLLAEQTEAPFADVEELHVLVAEGKERGFLTFDEIAVCLEEVEVTKEQVQELHSYLLENGIEVVNADGKPALSEQGSGDGSAPKEPDAP